MKCLINISIFLLFSCNNEHAEMPINKAVQSISIPDVTVLSTNHLLQLKNGIWYLVF